MSVRNMPRSATVFRIDFGKDVFHVVGLDARGTPIQTAHFRRETLLQFFEQLKPALVDMEACPGSQWLARRIQAFGHQVRTIPAQFVKPYVKWNKNDIIDAAAIAEAVTRPAMRFVALKRPKQVDLQALHRIRDQLVGSRRRLISQMRAFFLEYGVAIRPGTGVFKHDLPRVIADESNGLMPTMHRLLEDLYADLGHLEARINQLTKEIEALADKDEDARHLKTIPGIGALGATALLAAISDGRQFRKARNVAAWPGRVPRQNSTGGKTTLLGITKRGNAYLRRRLIDGARSCFTHMDRRRDRLASWLDVLEARMHSNKAVVALAAKMAHRMGYRDSARSPLRT